MKYLEYPVFPKPVIVLKYEEDFTQELEYIKSISYEQNRSAQGRTSDNTYLLYEPEMKKLKQFFQKGLNFFMEEMFKSKQKVVISQSWATLIKKGEGFDLHDHPNSLINGCFYFNVHKNSSPLVLVNGRKNFLYVDTVKETKYNTDRFSVLPGPGQLILFPNNLNHKVFPSQEEMERRSLAFNTTIIDKIGSKFHMTEIDLDKIKKNNPDY